MVKMGPKWEKLIHRNLTRVPSSVKSLCRPLIRCAMEVVEMTSLFTTRWGNWANGIESIEVLPPQSTRRRNIQTVWPISMCIQAVWIKLIQRPSGRWSWIAQTKWIHHRHGFELLTFGARDQLWVRSISPLLSTLMHSCLGPTPS